MAEYSVDDSYRRYEFNFLPQQRYPVGFKVYTYLEGDISAHIQQGNAITSEEVLKWFPKDFPKESAFDFAEFLNVLRITKHIDEFEPPQPLQDFNRALYTLIDNFPVALGVIQESLDTPNPYKTSKGWLKEEEYKRRLLKIQKELLALKKENMISHMSKKPLSWHEDAMVIAIVISYFVRRKGRRLSFTRADSILTTLIKKSLQRAIGKHVESYAIAQALKRFPSLKQIQNRMKYAPG